ncbi:hypothetical protein DFJ73DRAFT_779183 [Zopfochytrium polystomum]|nr:hypothetical protein DFJ73DRAFT_779183 [Zopfochytrium polystomum]
MSPMAAREIERQNGAVLLLLYVVVRVVIVLAALTVASLRNDALLGIVIVVIVFIIIIIRIALRYPPHQPAARRGSTNSVGMPPVGAGRSYPRPGSVAFIPVGSLPQRKRTKNLKPMFDPAAVDSPTSPTSSISTLNDSDRPRTALPPLSVGSSVSAHSATSPASASTAASPSLARPFTPSSTSALAPTFYGPRCTRCDPYAASPSVSLKQMHRRSISAVCARCAALAAGLATAPPPPAASPAPPSRATPSPTLHPMPVAPYPQHYNSPPSSRSSLSSASGGSTASPAFAPSPHRLAAPHQMQNLPQQQSQDHAMLSAAPVSPSVQVAPYPDMRIAVFPPWTLNA